MKYGFRVVMTVVALLALTGMTGCTVGEHAVDGPKPDADREAALTVSVPGMRTPSTRALNAAKEKELKEANVLIIRTSDNKLLEHYRVEGSEITAAGGANDWQFKVQGVGNTSGITIAVIANASIEVSKALAKVERGGTWVGASKANFLTALISGSVARWNTSTTGYWAIPMYGEAAIGDSGSVFDGVPPVNLTRILAKVDVANNIAPSGNPVAGNFSLTAVHVVNYNTKGRIAPAWDTRTGVIGSTPATTPNLPPVPDKQVWAEGNQLTYTATNNAVTNEIYLFESTALSDNPATPTGLRLVFEGDFTNADETIHCYYPVDFTTPAGDYMPVLRNNRYQFTVTEAMGRGCEQLGEAVASFGVMSNLRTSLLVVDESGITHTVWNGEHYLGSGGPVTLAYKAGSTESIPVTTNYAGGWQIDTTQGDGTGIVYQGASTDWLTAVKVGASNDQNANLSLTAGSVWMDAMPRIATVHLKAGRLRLTVTVMQKQQSV